MSVRLLRSLACNHLLNFANISSLRIKLPIMISVTKKDIILPTKYVIDQQDIDITKIGKFRLARSARS